MTQWSLEIDLKLKYRGPGTPQPFSLQTTLLSNARIHLTI